MLKYFKTLFEFYIFVLKIFKKVFDLRISIYKTNTNKPEYGSSKKGRHRKDDNK